MARKNFRSQEAVITVKTNEAAQTCTVVAPENGTATPAGEANVGDTIAYKCEKGFKITGNLTYYHHRVFLIFRGPESEAS